MHIAVSRVICCVHAMSCGRQSLQPLRSPPFRLMESYENNRQGQLIRTRSGPTDQGTAERSGLGGPNSCGLEAGRIGKLFYCACFSPDVGVRVCGQQSPPPLCCCFCGSKGQCRCSPAKFHHGKTALPLDESPRQLFLCDPEQPPKAELVQQIQMRCIDTYDDGL